MNILEVKDLSLKYGSQQILNHISFAFKKGEIIGLLGPNGAGKSSILKILAGLVFSQSGKLIYDKIPQSSFTNLRSHCGYLIDSPSFYPFLTARQNLNLIKKLNKSNVDIDELLLKVGLQDALNKRVKYFSMGMKQRLAIALTLLRSPEILILDEPFNGLDPNGFQDLILLLKGLNEKGITILISSHLLNELEQLADYFILLHQGNIELNISKTELLQTKNRIAFTFEEKLTSEVIHYLEGMSTEFESDYKSVVNLDPEEVSNIVKTLVKMGCVPVKVEALTILQKKYLEITK